MNFETGEVVFFAPTGQAYAAPDTWWYGDGATRTIDLSDGGSGPRLRDFTGWRSVCLSIGMWMPRIHLSEGDSEGEWVAFDETRRWTDIERPGGFPFRWDEECGLVDAPEQVEEWNQSEIADQWAKLRRPEWIAKWEERWE